jgi:hypothetical protein
MTEAASSGFPVALIKFVIFLVNPAARPITPRAQHTGGGGYQFKTGGRKKHQSPWFPPAEFTS